MATMETIPNLEMQFVLPLSEHSSADRKTLYRAFGPYIEAASENLVGIASCVVSYSRGSWLKLWQLDEIASGIDIHRYRDLLGDSNYLGNMPSCMDWWRDVMDYAVAESAGEGEWEGNPLFAPQIRHVVSLAKDAYAALVDAWAITRGYSNPDSNKFAHFDFLKKYRLFTRSVCSFVQEVWPDIDFEKLRAKV